MPARDLPDKVSAKMAGEGKEKGREGGKALCGNSMQNGVGRWKQLADIGREGCMQGFQMTDTWISKTHLSKCHVISGPSPILGSFLPMPPMV